MNAIYIKNKETLKKMSLEIRELKSHRKLKNRGSWDLSLLENKIRSLSHEFRLLHIAQSLYRGKTYEQIEPNCKRPPFTEINFLFLKIKQKINDYLDELKTGNEKEI